MKRSQTKLLNLFALLLLGYALYLNFFSKDEPSDPSPQHKTLVTKN